MLPLRGKILNVERARTSAYKIPETAGVFTLARGLLRLNLAERLKCSTEEIAFSLRPSGKPDLCAPKGFGRDWRFSVSHTGRQVALAFVQGVDIGIDIESFDRVAKPLDIARRYFTRAEFESLEGTEPSLVNRAFFAGWTRKEAIVKARGLTMAESLATLSVDLDPSLNEPGYVDAPGHEARASCRLASFEIEAQRLIGAVAILSERPPLLSFAIQSEPAFD